MIDSKMIDDLAKRVSDSLPEPIRSFQKDMEKQIRSTLTQGFERLDLVTREDFDVQVTLLERTRARLRELEERVSKLEGKPPIAETDGSDIT